MNITDLTKALESVAGSVRGLAAEHAAKVDRAHALMLELHTLYANASPAPTRQDAESMVLAGFKTEHPDLPPWQYEARNKVFDAVNAWMSEQGLGLLSLRR
jgi:hypothetical protein